MELRNSHARIQAMQRMKPGGPKVFVQSAEARSRRGPRLPLCATSKIKAELLHITDSATPYICPALHQYWMHPLPSAVGMVDAGRPLEPCTRIERRLNSESSAICAREIQVWLAWSTKARPSCAWIDTRPMAKSANGAPIKPDKLLSTPQSCPHRHRGWFSDLFGTHPNALSVCPEIM